MFCLLRQAKRKHTGILTRIPTEHKMFLNRYGCFIKINCHTPTKRKLKLNGEIALTILRILQKPCEKFNQTWPNASIGEMDGSL